MKKKILIGLGILLVLILVPSIVESIKVRKEWAKMDDVVESRCKEMKENSAAIQAYSVSLNKEVSALKDECLKLNISI